jgi:glycosyltransferase involved in cell wall biosynthesis
MVGTEGLNQVTVIIVTFNSAHCLPALGKAQAQFPHVIVVDNGSDDNCATQTPAHLPQAQVLALPENLGFGAANNRALAQVQTPFALLLNPDCEITPQAVQQLLHTARQWPEAALVAPQLLQPTGKLEVNYRWPHLLWNSRGPAATEGPACVGFVCGAAMLLRMSAYQGQFFDEQFFLYYEDDDLCLRFFKAGLPMVVVPSVQDNSPNVVIEAISLGIPVIGSDAGGIPELLQYFALPIFPNRNSKELSVILEAIPRLLENKLDLMKARELFSPDAHGESLLQIYRSI